MESRCVSGSAVWEIMARVCCSLERCIYRSKCDTTDAGPCLGDISRKSFVHKWVTYESSTVQHVVSCAQDVVTGVGACPAVSWQHDVGDDNKSGESEGHAHDALHNEACRGKTRYRKKQAVTLAQTEALPSRLCVWIPFNIFITCSAFGRMSSRLDLEPALHNLPAGLIGNEGITIRASGATTA
jgi:hypothetical protein